MLKLVILSLFVAITPLSVSVYGEISYETDPDYYLEHDPTICYISFDYSQEYENVTKQAISDWQNGLQQYTNNYGAWNIHYKFIPINHYDDVNDNVDSLGCDIFVDFVEIIYSNNDGSILEEANGNTGTLTSGPVIIDISTSKELSYEQLVTTATHELGHAFGLDHYITDDEELIEKWDQGIDVPSIMIEATDTEKITEIDLDKIVSIYGTDGFERPSQQIPEWIKTIFVYYGNGSINDSELINAIRYLVENKIIQIN